MPYPAIYRAKAVQATAGRLTVFVPQVFGEASIEVSDIIGEPMPGMGWVLFQGGNPEFPVWMGGGNGNGNGPPGPPGPPGPQGPPGFVVVQHGYDWKTDTTATDPGYGFIKRNATSTELYVSVYDKAGQAIVALVELETGDRITLYESDAITNRVQYAVTGSIVNHGDQWLTVPVAVVITIGFAPSNNDDVELFLPLEVPDEVWIGPDQPTDESTELWVRNTDITLWAKTSGDTWTQVTTGGGGGGGGVDEVHVGPNPPPLGTEQLWFDTDAPTPPIVFPEEVIIGAVAPTSSDTNLWVNTNDNNSMYAYVGGVWTKVAADVVVPNEVAVGPSDPGTDVELWYDTDEAALQSDAVANPNNALGVVAYAEALSDIANSTQGATILQVNFTAVEGRVYKATFQGVGQFGSVSSVMHNALKLDNSEVLAEQRYTTGAVNEQVTHHVVCPRFTTTAGSHYVNLASSMTGTPPVHFTSWSKRYLVIEDIGPVGSPALPIPTAPPAWTPLTVQSGWTAGSGEQPGYRKIGDIVYLRGTATLSGTYQSAVALITLPVGFRPGLSYLRLALPALKANVGGCYLIRGHIGKTDGVLVLSEYTNPDQSNPQVTFDGIQFSVTP